MTFTELYQASRGASRVIDMQRAKYLLRMRTAMGEGTTDEKLIRLMVWVAASLPVGEYHSRLEYPLEILISGEAWCDQHVRVFLWGAKELLSLPGRLLVLKHTDGKNGHTVCEVRDSGAGGPGVGAWKLFDVHPFHVACYRRDDGSIMDFEAIRKNPQVVAKQGHWWKGEDGQGKEGFYVAAVEVHTSWNERPLSVAR